MKHQIELQNTDIDQRLGSFEDQLEKITHAVAKAPLLSTKHQINSLTLELFAGIHRRNVILVFDGIGLHNSVDRPNDEIHAWLMRLIKHANLPFIVLSISEITQPSIGPDPRTFIRAGSIKLSQPRKVLACDNLTGDQSSIISGFQLLCTRQTPYAADIPIQKITELMHRFIQQVATKLPSDFSSIYLHSCTHKAVIFILPYYKHYNYRATQQIKHLINTALRQTGLPYLVTTPLFKSVNCFSPPYEQSRNSSYLALLETGELIPEHLNCALSAQTMDDPVTMPDTPQVVDRHVIELEIQLRGINPYNRQPLTAAQLIPCPELMSQINDHVLGMVRHRIQRGTRRFKEKKYEQAIHDFSTVYSYCAAHLISNPQEYSIVLNNLACCYRNIMDYARAIEYFQALLSYDLRSHASLKDKTRHLQKLADVYLTIRLPEIAKKYFTFARNALINDGDQVAAEGVNLMINQCESLSASIGESFERELSSLHSMCVHKEKQFHSDYRELIRIATPPEGPFVIFSNDYNDLDPKYSIVPYRYSLVLNKDPNYLKDIHKSYDVKNMSKKVLLAAIRDLQAPCLSASFSLEKNHQGMVIKVNILFILYLQKPTQGHISSHDVTAKSLLAINKRVNAFMPKIDTRESTGATDGVFPAARTSMLFAQPNTMSSQAKDIEVTIYTFANCLQVDNLADARALRYILNTHSCTLCVSTTLKDYVDNEMPKVLSRLDSHMKKHGKIYNHPDRREMLRELAHLHHESINTDKAIDVYRQVIAIDRAMISEGGNSLTSHLLLACDLLQLGKIYKQQGNHSRAFNCLSEALAEYMKGKIEESAAVSQLQQMITQYKPAAKRHAVQIFCKFFKRPPACDVATPDAERALESASP